MSETSVSNGETPNTADTVVVAIADPPLELPAVATAHPPAAFRSASRTRSRHWVFPQAVDTARSLLMILVSALFCIMFIMQPFRIPSESMERTLLVGDFLLVNKSMLAPAGVWHWLLPYRAPKHNDIVVFHFPLDPADHVVKRVIAKPGDRVRLENGRAVVNGVALPEPYAVFQRTYADAYRDQFPAVRPSDPAVDLHWAVELRSELENGQLVVPEDSYFVLGDNRNHSRDSRYWGYVPGENIVGSPFLIYFSIRQHTAADEAGLPDDRLGKSVTERLLDFARWDRVLRVVR